MKEVSRLIYISKDQKLIKEFQISSKKIFTYLAIFLIIFSVIGKFGLDMLVDFSHNSRIKRLERTNTVLQARLTEIQEKIKGISEQMQAVVSKDDELRVLLGLDKLSPDARQVGIGGAREYDLSEEVLSLDDKTTLSNQLTALSQLEREVKLEINSYQNLISAFHRKQDSLAYLPALKPVVHGTTISGFGRRYHPVYKMYRHHDGVDINAPKGTPIYASADGEVVFAGVNGGLGKMVQINHKYGFQTHYGHMNRILVRPGQKVERGEKIGEVGNTGITTGTHLHYEVKFKGESLDPSLYYFEAQNFNEEIVKK